MRGSITRRGRESWRLRFDVGVDASGKRKVQSVTVRGTKRQAQAKLTELLAAIDKGSTSRHRRSTSSSTSEAGCCNGQLPGRDQRQNRRALLLS